MKDENNELTELNAHKLGLISSEDIKDPLDELEQKERKEYVAAVAASYGIMKKELDNAIQEQVNYLAKHAESWEKVLIARGSINMGYVLIERLTNLYNEHKDNIKPKEDFDKYNVI